MKRKGQAAMEFLMTYGWAILVVLAAIGALAYFGILSPDKVLPNSFTMAGGFSAGQYKVTAGTPGTLQLSVINNLGAGVSAANMTIEDSQGNNICSEGVIDLGAMANGEESALQTCTITNPATLNVGDKFKATVKVQYVKSGETLSHTASGSITAAAEE